MRVTLDGGVPVAIAPTLGDPKGGAWGRDGTIVFSSAQLETGLWRVASTGGSPSPVTMPDVTQGDNAHRWPAFLPDGVHVVYFVRSRSPARRGVYVSRIDHSEPGTMLVRSDSEAAFARGRLRGQGYLLIANGDYVEVRRLDLERLQVAGDPFRLQVPAAANSPHHGAMLAVSEAAALRRSPRVGLGARRGKRPGAGPEHRELAAAITRRPAARVGASRSDHGRRGRVGRGLRPRHAYARHARSIKRPAPGVVARWHPPRLSRGLLLAGADDCCRRRLGDTRHGPLSWRSMRAD